MTITFIPARDRPSSLPDDPQTGSLIIDALSFVALHPWPVFLIYLLILNSFTWFLFWIDKRRAIQREWRVSEKTLLLLVMLGGTAGAFAARKVFRHKTRKQPFVSFLRGITAFQIVFVVIPIGLLILGKNL